MMQQQQPRGLPPAAPLAEAAAGGGGGGRQPPPKRRLEGLGLLLLAALVGGTYSPTLRLAYSLPQPPSPAVMAASRGCLELLLLSLLLALLAVARHRQAGLPRRPSLPGSGSPAAGEEAQQPLLPARQGHALQQAVVEVEEGEETAAQVQRPLPLSLPAAVLGALEIGAYTTAGNLAHMAGLSLTTATRGAFLIQATAAFTPLLAALAGAAPSKTTLLGSALALAGTLVIAFDKTGRLHGLLTQPGGGAAAPAAAAGPSPLLGDGLVMFAALCHSAAIVRIPAWAVRRGVPPLQLAAGKAAVLAAASTTVLGLAALREVEAGQPAASLWPGWRQPLGWAFILWMGTGPGALTSFLHVKASGGPPNLQLPPDVAAALALSGSACLHARPAALQGQTLAPPTDAQIMFTSVPVWSALLAAAVLPAEPLTHATLLGGSLVLGAGLVAALASRGGTGTGSRQGQA